MLTSLSAFNAFTLLLFSGAIELDTMGRGLVVDGWLRYVLPNENLPTSQSDTSTILTAA